MRSPWIIVGIIVGLVVVVISGLSLLNSNPGRENGKIKVVAAANFWGNMAAQIGGDRVEVTSIISDPEADPHLYESDAKAASAIGRADLVITNGLGYDDFMEKLLSTSQNERRTIVVAAETAGVTGDQANPHIWYDATKVTTVAKAVEAKLADKDPGHQDLYQANLTAFINSWQPFNDTVATIKAKYPGAPVAYTERVAGYLLDNAGLITKTPEGFTKAIEEATDPSPTDTAAMEALINNHQIKALLYNAQATSPVTEHVRDLAVKAGIPVIGVTETLPSNEPTFQSWQLHQAQALLQALGN